MSLQSCTKWLSSCGLSDLGFDQLFRLLLRDNGTGCPAIEVVDNSAPGNVLNSALTPVLIESVEPVGTKTLTGLYAAFGVWKAANPTKTPVFVTPLMGGDGVPGILVQFK